VYPNVSQTLLTVTQNIEEHPKQTSACSVPLHQDLDTCNWDTGVSKRLSDDKAGDCCHVFQTNDALKMLQYEQ
jgi:hypothetical protein